MTSGHLTTGTKQKPAAIPRAKGAILSTLRCDPAGVTTKVGGQGLAVQAKSDLVAAIGDRFATTEETLAQFAPKSTLKRHPRVALAIGSIS